ncbi:glycine--tRNA ligase subunit beta [Candidatus Margulisiibacteriota bacterium]
MSNLLFEIGTEEIPARFMRKALSELEKNANELLSKARLSFSSIRTLGTERRLALIVEGLAEKQADLDQDLKGPPRDKALESDGTLTRAGAGFMKKYGMKTLEFKKYGDVEYVHYRLSEKGKHAKEILPELLKSLVTSLHLPIAMRWGDLDMQFVRPIHWLVCLLDNTVVPFELAGIKSGNTTDGHRFLAKKKIKITSAAIYEEELALGYVIVDPDKRKKAIARGLAKIEKRDDLKVVQSEELLEEVTFLNECPEVLEDKVKDKYLDLPAEVLITTMQKNQKYFPFKESSGKLSPVFALVANGSTNKNRKNILEGNLKVLKARLEDAKFFWDEDLKQPLENNLEKLKHVVYQEKLGTLYEKVKRNTALVEMFADKLALSATEKQNALEIVKLSKCDLVSHMVYEFPNLQGIIGEKYASKQGKSEAVSKGIFEHYLPRGAGDALPKTKTGALVAIADKLESICGCFAAGLRPTSSQDPYALRRAAQGIVLIILDQDFNISLQELIKQGLSLHQAGLLEKDVLDFFKGRLKFVLQERKVKYDLIDSVLAVPQEDILTTVHLGEELQKVASKKDFNKFVDTGVRVYRLSKDAQEKAVQEEYFAEDVEKKVFNLVQIAEKELSESLIQKKYGEAVEKLYSLAEPVDEYFVKVLVMDENEHKKNNRLSILKRLDKLFKKVGDFEKIVVEGAKK